MKTADVILSARSLSKRYSAGAGLEAVCGASLELRAGEFVSIVGRSGSGKSTLLAMLGALTEPTEGQVLLDGADLWRLPEAERAQFRCRRIGFVFQFPSLLANLTAADNVAVPAMLGRTMAAEEAYWRAHALLERVGLADRAAAFPTTLSGGEQRRVAIARALINAPPLLLADEPTSDLDEETEADIIALFTQLRHSEGFGLVLVTHNPALAADAGQAFGMRQGVLTPIMAAARAKRRPSLPPSTPSADPAVPLAAPDQPLPPTVALGRNLWRGAQVFVLAVAVALATILLLDFGVKTYQEARLRERGAALARLADLALSGLQGEVRSVADRGEGRYELTLTLRNSVPDRPIYVMSPDLRAYIQVGKLWQEVALEPVEDAAAGVSRIDGERAYDYVFEAKVKDFAQLLPYYMHVRFSGTMLVSPTGQPGGDVFERRDNYYVYLKPFDVADEAIAKRMKFAGRPPVWIPMPPH